MIVGVRLPHAPAPDRPDHARPRGWSREHRLRSIASTWTGPMSWRSTKGNRAVTPGSGVHTSCRRDQAHEVRDGVSATGRPTKGVQPGLPQGAAPAAHHQIGRGEGGRAPSSARPPHHRRPGGSLRGLDPLDAIRQARRAGIFSSSHVAEVTMDRQPRRSSPRRGREVGLTNTNHGRAPGAERDGRHVGQTLPIILRASRQAAEFQGRKG